MMQYITGYVITKTTQERLLKMYTTHMKFKLQYNTDGN